VAQLTLLQIVQAVTGELGLVQPSVVVGATDLQTLQLFRLVNRTGDNLKRDHDWTVLQTLFTLDVTAPTVTTGNTSNGSAVSPAFLPRRGLSRELCGDGIEYPGCGAGALGR
jgi:hypothetical protein